MHKWNSKQLLKFTQCNEHEFTCHTYGHCLSMNLRCNGHPDCPEDGSDENDCKLMILSKGYDKGYPPRKNLTCFMSLFIYDIMEIDELEQSYKIDFRITLKWFDSRIMFKNLKPTSYENMLDDLEIGKLWTPKLYLINSYNDYMEAGQRINDHGKGLWGSVEIHRKGSPQQNELSELNEDHWYPGNENPISMVNEIAMELGCKIDLKW